MQQRANEKKLAYLEAQARKSVSGPVAVVESSDGDTRFSARSVAPQRRRTGLSAADYAKLVGVSPLTIYNWEHNKSRPRQGQFKSLVALRGLGKREALAKLAPMDKPAKPAAKRGRPRKAK